MLCQAPSREGKVHRDEFEALFTMENRVNQMKVYNMHKKQ